MVSKAVFVCVAIFCSLQVLEGSVLQAKREADQVNLAGFDPIGSIRKIIQDIQGKVKEVIAEGQKDFQIVRELFNDTIHGNEEAAKKLLEDALANITKNLPPAAKVGVEAAECTVQATEKALRVAANAMTASISCTVDDINEVLKPLLDVYNASATLISAGTTLATGAAECFKDVSAWTVTGDLICFINKINAVRKDLTSSLENLIGDLQRAAKAVTNLGEDIRKCPQIKLADAISQLGQIIEEHAQCVENHL